MNNRNLFDYYQTNEILYSIHKWSPEYTDSLIPYEKELYIKLISNRLKIKQQEESQEL